MILIRKSGRSGQSQPQEQFVQVEARGAQVPRNSSCLTIGSALNRGHPFGRCDVSVVYLINRPADECNLT